jgi:DNA-binding CsgD family transcriptional regulator
VIVTRRTATTTDPGTGSAASLPGAPVIVLPPLPRADVHRLLGGRLPRRLPDSVVDRVHAATCGNPLHALELGRLLDGTRLAPGAPLPVPPSLREVLTARLTALPEPTRDALGALALLARPTVAQVEALGLTAEVARAERAALVEARDGVVHFAHPLLAAAALELLPGSQRPAIHRALASVATDPAEQVRHRALALLGPNEAVAADVADVARELRTQGAHAASADLAVLALRCTPAEAPERWARVVLAGETLFRAARTDEALTTLGELRDACPPGAARAEGLLALASIVFSTGRSADAARLATEALALASASPSDRRVQAAAHATLARVNYADFPAAADHAAAALALLEQLPDATRFELAASITASAAADFIAGRGLDGQRFARAIELEEGAPVFLADTAFAGHAALRKYADELEPAREMLESLLRAAGDDESALPYALSHLPQLELWTGHWQRAEDYARRHLDVSLRLGQEAQADQARLNLALVAAFRGDVTAAHELGHALVTSGNGSAGPDGDDPWTERAGAGILGLVAMLSADAPTAVRWFGRAAHLAETMGLREPGYRRFDGDHIEALVAVGDLDRAAEVHARLVTDARRVGRVSALSAAARGHALILAASGQGGPAIAAAEEALVHLERTPLVYDRARALLTLGQVLRRSKAKARARDALQSAIELFDAFGAAPFAERSRRELARVGLRPAAPLDLTATEQRVAELAASGATTRQIAEQVFLAPKSVEANLTRVYRKLGVRTRVELAHWFATRTSPTDPPPPG